MRAWEANRPSDRARGPSRLVARLALATMVLAPLALGSTSARAQGAPSAATLKARDLASRGRAAFDRGDRATGCPLLDEAYRVDGQLLGAGYALAECREKEGKLATAHRTFLEIAEKAAVRGEARADEAKARAAALLPRLSRLTVDVSPKAAARGDLVIEVDGKPWPRSAWGAAEAIDGGTHEIAARAGGADPWIEKVEIANEGTTIVVALPLDRDPDAPPPRPAPAPSAPPAEEGSPFPWRTAGLVGGGVGVGILGLGVVLGLVAKGDYDAVEADCDSSNACTADAAAARDDARGLAHVGTALFIGGGIVAAAGVTVFLLAPDEGGAEGTSAAIRVAPGSIAVDGRF